MCNGSRKIHMSETSSIERLWGFRRGIGTNALLHVHAHSQLQNKRRIKPGLFPRIATLVHNEADRAMSAFACPVLPLMATKGQTNSSWLGYKEEFQPLRTKLSIDWLARYRVLPFHTLDTLFNIAAGFADRERLKEIILERCAEFMFFWPDQTEDEELEQRRKFWFFRALYFIPALPDVYFDWLAADKDTVLAIYERSGRGNRIDNEAWPSLTACKVEAILDVFIGVWPKVPLPGSHDLESPNGEKAYRCLSELVWSISSDSPDAAIPVLKRLISDSRYADMLKDLKSIRTGQTEEKGPCRLCPTDTARDCGGARP